MGLPRALLCGESIGMSDAMPSVLITGAARRLGKVMAQRFADEGWHVIIHHLHSEDDADALASSLPSAEVVAFDIGDPEAIEHEMRSLAERIGDWRALVNCASVFAVDEADAIDRQVFAEAMDVNARGPVLLAQAFLRHARSDGGRRIVNVLDQKLANLNPDFFSYTMAKAALAAATDMLAMAAGSGDRVYGLYPGAMLPSFDQHASEHERSGRMNLLSRLTQPVELADAAVFLAGGALASGQAIFVDSGQHLLSQPRDVLFLARETP